MLIAGLQSINSTIYEKTTELDQIWSSPYPIGHMMKILQLSMNLENR